MADATNGLVKLVAPEGVNGVGHGPDWFAAVKRVVEVPAHMAKVLLDRPHNFAPFVEKQDKAKA